MKLSRNSGADLFCGAALVALLGVTSSALAQEAASPAPTNTDTVEAIIVTGVRGSLLRSIEAKRNATTIVDAISAEELGKFPDRNVAESLGNIPGVTVVRGRGAEGQNVTVRGLGPNFSITTLNGRILATDSNDRAFAFDVLPSEMISGAEVMKAVQATQLEGSIGGGIDLHSARPFDYKGFHLSGSVEGDYGDLSKKTGFKATTVVSSTFANDTLGALLSLSYSKRKIRTDNLREYAVVAQSETDQETDFNDNGVIDTDGAQYIWPSFYSVGTVLGTRERLGVSGALQYIPTDNLTVTLDGLYTYYDTSTVNYAQSNFLNPRNDATPGALTPQKWRPGSIRVDANNVVTNFALDDLVAEVLTYEEPRTVNTYQLGGRTEWQASERLKVNLDGYWSEARRNSAGKNRFVVAGITGASGVFATRDGGLPDMDITIPGGRTIGEATNDDYAAHYIGIQGDNLKDRIVGLKSDAKYDSSWGVLKSVQFGVGYTDRQKTSLTIDNANTTSCNYCGYPFTFGQINANVIKPLPVGNLLKDQAGNFPRDFAAFDIDAYLAALPKADNNPAILDPLSCEGEDASCVLSPYPAGYSTQVLQPNLALSYGVSEKTYVGYVQGNFEGDRWRADAGLRLLRTEVSSTGHSIEILSITKIPGNTADFDVELSDPVPVSEKGHYTKLLPSANFAYDLTEDLRLRLAAAKVISRPTFDQLSPASDASSASSGTFFQYFSGNPKLKPTTADQFDISLEWYLSRRSALSAAVFYKDISNFVTTVSNEEPIAGQTFVVQRVVNGDSAKVTGAEIAGQYLFDNGFGLQSNFTYNHSTAHVGDVKGKLDGAIPYSANFKVFYEKHGWSTQVSYSYNSSFTSRISGTIPGVAEKEAAYNELSASLSRDISENFRVFVEGSNLLDEKTERYNTYRNVPAFYEASGRSIFFGVRGRY